MKNDKNHDALKFCIHSNRVFCSNSMRRWWTMDHDTIIGKGDHNNNNRSYTIHITKTG